LIHLQLAHLNFEKNQFSDAISILEIFNKSDFIEIRLAAEFLLAQIQNTSFSVLQIDNMTSQWKERCLWILDSKRTKITFSENECAFIFALCYKPLTRDELIAEISTGPIEANLIRFKSLIQRIRSKSPDLVIYDSLSELYYLKEFKYL
jgi:hypothetical protein